MKVIQSIEGKEINIFLSVSQASKKLNIKRDLILRCCKGLQNKTKGFNFHYFQNKIN